MKLPGRQQLGSLPAALLASGAVFALVWGLHLAGLVQWLELKAYDALVRSTPPAAGRRSITVVRLTEQDIRSDQFSYPVTDRELTGLLSKLLEPGPRAVGVDIFRDIDVPPGRDELNGLLKDDFRVVVVWKYSADGSKRIGPPAVLEGTDQAGFGNVIRDIDGVVRRGLLFVDDEQGYYTSLPFELAVRYLAAEGVVPGADEDDPNLMRLGRLLFRPMERNDGLYVDMDAAGHQMLLDYTAARPFPSYSFGDVLAGRVDANDIRGKVVLVGIAADSVKDHFPTPIDDRMVGVEWNGYFIDQLLRAALDGAAHVRFLAGWQEAGWTLLWAVLGGCVGLAARSPLRFGAAAVAGIAAVGGCGAAGFHAGWWLPVVLPAGSWFLSAVVVTSYVSERERRQRRSLMRLFGQHVSREVAETVWRRRGELAGGPPWSERTTATVVFADLVDFSDVSKDLPTQRMVAWLNQYLEAVSALVIEHGGWVNKYIGDGVMAVFGAPALRTTPEQIGQDALSAVRCAVAIRGRLVELNERWHAEDLPAVGMRIGIHTGPLVAAIVGSRRRVEYTVLGGTVNVASRLESLDKEMMDDRVAPGRCRVLISGATLERLGGRAEARFVRSATVKGSQEPVDVFAVAAAGPAH